MSQPLGPGTDFERVGELFAEALEVEPGQREELLKAAVETSPEIVDEVRSLLLAHHDRSPLDRSFDSESAARLIESVAPALIPQDLVPQDRVPQDRVPQNPMLQDLMPRDVGPYRVLRELGRGGMGVVYLAERVEGGFEQRVALKLVKRGMDSEAILERFLRERQILARLEHPGIARLLDGGLTADDQPYFAMELVEAEPITTYANKVGLGLEGRLALFAEVCQAVQYAHGRLVVHRDLKPSNVLVAADGTVKLVDFGIAKVLDSDTGGAGATGLTVHEVRALTPEYASPEQIRGEPVTVVSDVYALGVLLYELLAGSSPYGKPFSTPAEIHRAVCEIEPVPPSGAILRGELPRGAEQRRLAKRLQGDLDGVILKALAKEAERRYPSVEALARDLHRYRHGLPVLAHQAGWAYRAKKFVGRHRVGVAAVTATGAMLVLGLAGTAWQASTAARERDRAQLESEKLLATQDYLVGLFKAADPAQALGQEVTAKELVARGVERLENELGDQPEVRFEMLKALSKVSLALGNYDQTERLLALTLEQAGELYGDDHVSVADHLVMISRVHNERGEWSKAEAVVQRAISIYQRLGSEAPSTITGARQQLATAFRERGDFEAAVAVQRQALEDARRFFGDRSLQVAIQLNNLGNLLKKVSDYRGAEDVFVESLATMEELHGSEHPHIATAKVNLAAVLSAQGDYQGAETFYRDGIAMERRLRGDKHPRLAIKLHNLATLLNLLGRFQEAVDLHRESLALIQESMGETGPYYAMALSSLGMDLAEVGQFQEAMALMEEGEPLLLKTLGAEHFTYSLHLRHRAKTLYLQGSHGPAIPLLEASIDIARHHPRKEILALMFAERALLRLSLGTLGDAEKDFLEALEIQRAAFSPVHPALVTSLNGLGWTLMVAGRSAEALELLREAVSIAEESLPRGHWLGSEARAALGAALVEAGRKEEGRPLLRDGYSQLRSSRGSDHPATRRAGGYLN
ncbi:MAG: serine/threonine-protein kinase [Deltaproteobacteria bacterium]|nr:serine/threonine-protein kinase [Deltaproteobacteria bacterium]